MDFRIRALAYSVGIPSIMLGLLPWSILQFSGHSEFSGRLFFSGLGVIFIFGGSIVFFSGAYYLGRRGDGTPLPFAPPKRMVVAGPYAHIQHPMHCGLLAILFGQTLWFQSLSIGCYTVGITLLVYLFENLLEEPALQSRFGEDYEAYRAVTPRWLPLSVSPPK